MKDLIQENDLQIEKKRNEINMFQIDQSIFKTTRAVFETIDRNLLDLQLMNLETEKKGNTYVD